MIRFAGSASFQYGWPASVVGTRLTASAADDRRGMRPNTRSEPATTCTTPLIRTSRIASSGRPVEAAKRATTGAATFAFSSGFRTASTPPEMKMGAMRDRAKACVIVMKRQYPFELGCNPQLRGGVVKGLVAPRTLIEFQPSPCVPFGWPIVLGPCTAGCDVGGIEAKVGLGRSAPGQGHQAFTCRKTTSVGGLVAVAARTGRGFFVGSVATIGRSFLLHLVGAGRERIVGIEVLVGGRVEPSFFG